MSKDSIRLVAIEQYWTLSFPVGFHFLMQFFARGYLDSHICEHIMKANKNRITQADWCDVYICYVVFIVFFRMTITSTGRCPHHINKHTYIHLFFFFLSFYSLNSASSFVGEKTNELVSLVFFFFCSESRFFFFYTMYMFSFVVTNSLSFEWLFAYTQ